MTQRGQVELTARGFQQDSFQAIGGDPIRGLIELITNADDAYRGHHGRIDIIIDRFDDEFPVAVSVFDQARGMSRAELLSKMTKLGGNNDDFAGGAQVRGNLGRGAKDCAAFGGILFRTIHAGEFCQLLLRDDGSYELEDSRTATLEDSENLKLGPTESGLCATMLFTQPYKTKLSAFSKLVEKLSNEAQLRDINNFQAVTLIDMRGRQNIQTLQPEDPEILRNVITIEGEVEGYENSGFTFSLDELKVRSETPLSSSSVQGIVISGSKAIYENTFLGLHTQPETRLLRGRIKAPIIDELIKKFDIDGPTAQNDARLVQRDRSGLDSTHPFMKALTRLLVPKLQAVIDEIRKTRGGNQTEGAELRNRFRLLGNVLQSEINQLLEDVEDNQDGENGGGDHDLGFVAIPGKVKILPGGEFSISLRFTTDSKPGRIKTLIAGAAKEIRSDTDWAPHRRLAAFTNTRRFVGEELGLSQIMFEVDGKSASVIVEVVTDIDVKIPDYSRFAFTQSVYRVYPGGARWVTLVAPDGYEEAVIRVTSTSENKEFEVELNPSSDGFGRVSKFQVRSSKTEEIISITAVALSEEEAAACSLEVREGGGARAPEYDFKIENSDGNGSRSTVRPGTPKMVVAFGRHPANKRALGDYDESAGRFTEENSAEALRMLAELYSYELARQIVAQRAQTHPDDFGDAEQVMSRHSDYCKRLIASALKVLEAS
jgi:hypothetical protein